MIPIIPLSKGYGALVDESDLPAVLAAGPWHVAECGDHKYARHWYRDQFGRPHTIYMHTLLTGWSYVDHKNGDGLDNRRANLRPATPLQNSRNQRLSAANSTGYKGVNFYKRTGRWRAHIGISGRSQHLGYFATPEDAALAYDAAAREVFGEFAQVNFPEESAA